MLLHPESDFKVGTESYSRRKHHIITYFQGHCRARGYATEAQCPFSKSSPVPVRQQTLQSSMPLVSRVMQVLICTVNGWDIDALFPILGRAWSGVASAVRHRCWC